MYRAQRRPVSSASQDGCTPLEDAAPRGEHRMAGRTTLSPLCTPGQATGQGQAVVWGGCGASKAPSCHAGPMAGCPSLHWMPPRVP